MSDNSTIKPKTAVDDKTDWPGLLLSQPRKNPVLILGLIAFILTYAYKSGLEGSKIREQVDTWESQAAAQREPLSIEVAAPDAQRCEETMMLMAKRGLDISIAGEPATMAKIAKACEGGNAEVTIHKGDN